MIYALYYTTWMRIIHGIIMKTKSHVQCTCASRNWKTRLPACLSLVFPPLLYPTSCNTGGKYRNIERYYKENIFILRLGWKFPSEWKKKLVCTQGVKRKDHALDAAALWAVEIRRSPGSSDLRRRRDLGVARRKGGVPGSLGNPLPLPPTTFTLPLFQHQQQQQPTLSSPFPRFPSMA